MNTGLREVVAGVAGFVTFFGLSVLLFAVSGYDPHRAVSLRFGVLSVACGMLFAFVAGYLVAIISPAVPIRPAVMVALFIAASAIFSMLTSFSGEWWSQLAALFLMTPMVLIGARVRARRGPNTTGHSHNVTI